MNGILIVDKPAGLTSAEVVRRIKRQVRVKVGHLGTLDPFATGILPLCLGEATKIAQFLNTADKRYEGVIRLGEATDSGDPTGRVVRSAAVPAFDEERLAQVAGEFTGELLQRPPMLSALKRDGVPLYRLARRGIEVQRPQRAVRIAELRLEQTGESELGFEIACSKGTYVRVLAEDIGMALGTVAHLRVLRRTQFGGFDQTVQPVQLDGWDARRATGLISIREALSHLPAVSIGARPAQAARLGQAGVLRNLPPPADRELAVLIDPADTVVAVLVRRGGGWVFGRVLREPQSLQPVDPVLNNDANAE